MFAVTLIGYTERRRDPTVDQWRSRALADLRAAHEGFFPR